MVNEKEVIRAFPVQDVLLKPIDSAAVLSCMQRLGVAADPTGYILVVDDDHKSLGLMDAILKGLGYGAICKVDGAAALAAVKLRPPLAVVLDLVMPEMDGFEFLDRFRAEATNHRVPVIIWTSKDLTDEERKSLGERADAVHRKLDGNLTSLLTDLRRFLPAPHLVPTRLPEP